MIADIPTDWKQILQCEFEKKYFKELTQNVNRAYLEKVCFPPKKEIFNAFKHCSFNHLKVVIIGQDPYHGLGQANGLCFSVADYVPHPPSLKNMLKELVDDIGCAYPIQGNLEKWAKQGVLLLNHTLTVEQAKANSHVKFGWNHFTDAVIDSIVAEKKDVVFLLWGGFAHKKGKNINTEKHLVLKSGHPSPLSANQGKWFGNQHFSKTNTYLKSKGLQIIDWDLEV